MLVHTPFQDTLFDARGGLLRVWQLCVVYISIHVYNHGWSVYGYFGNIIGSLALPGTKTNYNFGQSIGTQLQLLGSQLLNTERNIRMGMGSKLKVNGVQNICYALFCATMG